MTPLILASKDCAVTMAKQLLDRQAEPGIADHKGNGWLKAINFSGEGGGQGDRICKLLN